VGIQLAGATTGAAFVKAVDTSRYNLSGGGANQLAPGINRASGWLMETILTAALVYMVFAAVDPVRQQTTAHIPVRLTFQFHIKSYGFPRKTNQQNHTQNFLLRGDNFVGL
jgi:glycerol uptake facilitator-like aquaporin